MRYFVQHAADETLFDEIPCEIFDQRQKVVDDNGQRRYSDNYFSLDGADIGLQFQQAPKTILRIVALAMGSNIQTAPAKTGGYIREPEYLRIKKGRGFTLHNLKTGEKFARK